MKTEMPIMTVHNLKIHYREQGAAQQPTLLLIHGLGCSLKYWACVFAAPELAHYRIIALDLPGFGLSAKPDTFDYSLRSQADLVAAFIRARQAQELTLIGHSMGGSVAILAAHRYPELARRLLVIEPNLKANDAQLSREIIQDSEAEFVTHYAEFQQTAIATVQDWFVNSQRADIDAYIDDLLKTTPISMYRSAHSLIAVTTGETMLTQFQQLALPKYLLIGGETMKVRPLPPELRNGTVQTVIVPGVGHMMMVDNPRLFSKTLASILQ